MGAEHVAVYIVISTALLLLACSPPFRLSDPTPSARTEHNPGIDGLRGFLAYGVFFHHATIYQRFLSGHPWELPPVHADVLAGQGGVALFFMITAYLFWGRAVAGIRSWPRLYMGRLFRIGPLYLFAVLILFAVVSVRTGFDLLVPSRKLVSQIVRWLALGMGGAPNINGYPDTARILAGVTWSLGYEWAFYGALMVLAFFRRMHLAFALILFAAAMVATGSHPSTSPSWQAGAALFGAGMVVASLRAARPDLKFSERTGSIMFLGCLALLPWVSDTAYAPVAVGLLGLAFFCVASGATVFGLLISRPAIRLGNISYGIYLLQGIAFAGAFALIPGRALALAGEWQYWTAIALIAGALAIFALAAHYLIEVPGMALGKRFVRARVEGAAAFASL